MKKSVVILLALAFACAPLLAQSPEAKVSRKAKAISMTHTGSSKFDMRATDLMARAGGEGKVERKTGRAELEVKVSGLDAATSFGLEYLTYVLWAISPQGRAVNLGELVLEKGMGKLKATTELQKFGLVVTAEPYFAVTQPSNLVVLENAAKPGALEGEEIVSTYELIPRGAYSSANQKIENAIFGIDPRTPLALFEARNAIRIARASKAETYAAAVLAKAEQSLQKAEAAYRDKQAKTTVETFAREAAQNSEDARLMSVKQQEEERLAKESLEREAKARAQAEEEAARRKQAEEDRTRAEEAMAEAKRMREEAELAAQQAAAAKAEAEAARAEALQQKELLAVEADKARKSAEESERLRQEAEKDKSELRARLLNQLNSILETRDSARGLIANMGDVLFETGKFNLRPEARERLAKVSGILLAYSGLKVAIEGHTDSVGTEDYNLQLSKQRADAVREYLVKEGVQEEVITAIGLGMSQPIAGNETADGRKKNRRVELVVSGEAIGVAAKDQERMN